MGDVGLVIIGSALTLLGGLVVHIVRRKDEHAAWLRERRLEAYAQILQASHAVLREVIEEMGWRRLNATETANAAQDAGYDALMDLRHATTRIKLLGPPTVYNAAREIEPVALELLRAGTQPIPELEDVPQAVVKAFGNAETEFVERAAAAIT